MILKTISLHQGYAGQANLHELSRRPYGWLRNVTSVMVGKSRVNHCETSVMAGKVNINHCEGFQPFARS